VWKNGFRHFGQGNRMAQFPATTVAAIQASAKIIIGNSDPVRASSGNPKANIPGT
jgi:hypothetical protein